MSLVSFDDFPTQALSDLAAAGEVAAVPCRRHGHGCEWTLRMTEDTKVKILNDPKPSVYAGSLENPKRAQTNRSSSTSKMSPTVAERKCPTSR